MSRFVPTFVRCLLGAALAASLACAKVNPMTAPGTGGVTGGAGTAGPAGAAGATGTAGTTATTGGAGTTGSGTDAGAIPPARRP